MVKYNYGHTKNGRRSIPAPGKERCFMSIIEVLTLGILICDIIKILLDSKKK